MTTPSPSSDRGDLLNRSLKMAPCLASLLLPLAALAESQPVATEQHAQSIPRIATVDWTVAETLLALIIFICCIAFVRQTRQTA